LKKGDSTYAPAPGPLPQARKKETPIGIIIIIALCALSIVSEIIFNLRHNNIIVPIRIFVSLATIGAILFCINQLVFFVANIACVIISIFSIQGNYQYSPKLKQYAKICIRLCVLGILSTYLGGILYSSEMVDVSGLEQALRASSDSALHEFGETIRQELSYTDTEQSAMQWGISNRDDVNKRKIEAVAKKIADSFAFGFLSVIGIHYLLVLIQWVIILRAAPDEEQGAPEPVGLKAKIFT